MLTPEVVVHEDVQKFYLQRSAELQHLRGACGVQASPKQCAHSSARISIPVNRFVQHFAIFRSI